MKTTEKLKALRMQLVRHKLAGFIQPVHDEYMNEYPPASARRVEWLSGFAGSAGALVTLKDKAALFVDGRYTLQAKAETDAKLFEHYNSGSLLPEAWVANHLSEGKKIGYDATLYGRDTLRRMQRATAAQNIEWVPVDNLIDAIWKNRPAAPASALFIHEPRYSGETSLSKRWRVAVQLKAAGVNACIISMPDSVNWLLNIRGSDVEGSPLALVTAILNADGKVQLCVASSRCSKELRAHLGSEVTIVEPVLLEKSLKQLAKKSVLCDPQSLPVWYLQKLIAAGATVVDGQDPCLILKAQKNRVELQGMRTAHLRDGAAVVKCLSWLDGEVLKRPISEIEVCDQLLSYRAAHASFVSPSFNTISGSGPNGAIVHYRVSQATNRMLKDGELFLLDSGGQYPDGTTDITRTVPIGKPSREHKDRFTRVLKGHIAIATAIFPEGTTGSQIDVLARQFLWEAGLDYDHGTGHGVGYFLNVHEGPQRISKRGGDAALQAGMIVSNEPGYYKSEAYGIRIENLVAVIEKSKGETGKNYLGFETLTCVPIDTRLIEISALTIAEKKWLNDYHTWVEKQLSPGLEPATRKWLKIRCTAI